MCGKIRLITCFQAQNHICECLCFLPLLKEVTCRARCHLPEDVAAILLLCSIVLLHGNCPYGVTPVVWTLAWVCRGESKQLSQLPAFQALLLFPGEIGSASGEQESHLPLQTCPWRAGSHHGPPAANCL